MRGVFSGGRAWIVVVFLFVFHRDVVSAGCSV